jgi:iron(III) transport system permease protein
LSLSHSFTGGSAWRGGVRLWPRHAWAFAVALAIAGFVAAPIVSLVRTAAIGDAEIAAHLTAYVLPVAMAQTTLLLLGVGGVTSVVGAGTAWLVTTFQFRGRGILLWLLPLPLAIPTYIGAYIYVDILDTAGPVQSMLRTLSGWHSPADYWFPPIRSLGGAIFIMGFVLYPYTYLAARAMFQTQHRAFVDAARTLGARPWSVAFRITLPLARPALAVGIALTLLETLNDIGASEYLGVQTLTLAVFTTWLNRGSLPGAAQIALVMLGTVAALVALERYGRRGQAYVTPVHGRGPAPRIPLAGARARLAVFLCLIPVALGFFIPVAFLLRQVTARGLLVGFDPALWRHTMTTLTLAAAATALVLLLALTATVAVRLAKHPLIAGCVNFSTLGYAVPGTVLALGLLAPLIGVDEIINWVTMTLAGKTVGLVVAGSSLAVVIAYVVRFLAIGVGFLQAGFARVSTDFDDMARILGARPLALVRSVHLPLVRPALWGAALLIFIDCLKELPATLLLRPLNVETLATYIYQFATRGNFEQGALAALMIVAVGILPVVYIVRYADFGLRGPQAFTLMQPGDSKKALMQAGNSKKAL